MAIFPLLVCYRGELERRFVVDVPRRPVILRIVHPIKIIHNQTFDNPIYSPHHVQILLFLHRIKNQHPSLLADTFSKICALSMTSKIMAGMIKDPGRVIR
jgi:hypothetical protein